MTPAHTVAGGVLALLAGHFTRAVPASQTEVLSETIKPLLDMTNLQ